MIDPSLKMEYRPSSALVDMAYNVNNKVIPPEIKAAIAPFLVAFMAFSLSMMFSLLFLK